MAGDYEKAITVQEAIENIVRRRYLLPAIQRKFTWKAPRICALFDSIMRGYPINTFMLWEVRSSEIKNSFRFYQFLENYCERFEENNPDFNTKGHGDFQAVIDGQQRLTSLYIGLKGTYAYKLQRKWWPKSRDESVLPSRYLYLNLAGPLDEERNEDMMVYEFSFLTNDEYKQQAEEKVWFSVGDILDFDEVSSSVDVDDVVLDYLSSIGQGANQFARETLARLYTAIRLDPLIHYYNEKDQTIDRVLNIFVRTNHGGVPLSYSDLLMSIAVASWKKDARQQIDDLVDQVRFGSDMEFSINRDWVLKAALMLTEADVRFKVENFTSDQVGRIEQEWDEIKACILATFRLIRSLGLHDLSLRAKNAAIPIAYYLYHKGRNPQVARSALYTDINKLARHDADRKLIARWLHMSLLKGVFGGQGDSILTALRKIIHGRLGQGGFPVQAIIEHFRGHSKDLRFDEEFIKRLLRTEKDDPACFSILALLMPDLDYTRSLERDHLHPAASFTSKSLDGYAFLQGDVDKRRFYANRENWNSVVNLHLLDASKNKSKRAQPLDAWVRTQPGLTVEALLIPHGTPLDFPSFPSFMEKREAHLASLLKQLSEPGARVPTGAGSP